MSTAKRERSRFAALAVGAGILLSRIAGLVRERVIAHYLGNSDAAGAFKAAFRWASAAGKGGAIIPTNPLDGMPLPTMRKRSAEVVVTDKEFADLLDKVQSPAVRDILLVAWETGTRPVNLARFVFLDPKRTFRNGCRWCWWMLERAIGQASITRASSRLGNLPGGRLNRTGDVGVVRLLWKRTWVGFLA